MASIFLMLNVTISGTCLSVSLQTSDNSRPKTSILDFLEFGLAGGGPDDMVSLSSLNFLYTELKTEFFGAFCKVERLTNLSLSRVGEFVATFVANNIPI